MPTPPLTSFRPAPALLKPLAECMGPFSSPDPTDPAAEWADAVLSRNTVVYGSGLIARKGEPVRHAVDPDELDLCRRLAKEAARVARPIGEASGLDAEGMFQFHPFFVAATAGDPPAGRIDQRLVRTRFGGTIHPAFAVRIEPIRDRRAWWTEVCLEEYPYREDPIDDPERRVAAWRALVHWFLVRPEFRAQAFVAIGGSGEACALRDEGVIPAKGAGQTVFPRLVVGLTKAGSLAGVFGHVTQT